MSFVTFCWRKFTNLANLLQPYFWKKKKRCSLRSQTFLSLFQTCWDNLYYGILLLYFSLLEFIIKFLRLLLLFYSAEKRWREFVNALDAISYLELLHLLLLLQVCICCIFLTRVKFWHTCAENPQKKAYQKWQRVNAKFLKKK